MKTDKTTGFDFTNTKNYSRQPQWLEYLKTTDNPSIKGYYEYRLKREVSNGSK